MRKLTLNYENSFTDTYVSTTLKNVEMTQIGGPGTKNSGIRLPVSTQSSWWDTDWSNRVKCVTDHDKIDANLTSFRLWIILDSTNFDFSVAQLHGEDIRLVDSDDTTELDHDIVYFDKAQQRAVVVAVITLSSSADNTFYLYYGNNAVADGSAPTTVWATSSYIAVLAFDETANTFYDLTANDNDGVNHGSSYINLGKIGACRNFDGSNDYISVADSASQDVTTNLTLSAVFKLEVKPGNTVGIVNHDESSTKYLLNINTSGQVIGQIRQTSGTTSKTSSDDLEGEWSLASLTFDKALGSNRLKLFVNDDESGQANAHNENILAGDEGFIVGREYVPALYYYYKGMIDTIIVEKVTRAVEWHKARYYAEVAQNLITFTEETYNYATALTGSFVMTFAPGIFGENGLPFPIRFDQAADPDGWVGLVCYGAEYDGTLSVSVYMSPPNFPLKFPIVFGQLHTTGNINEVIDLRGKSNKFPLTFPIEWGFHGYEIIVQVDFEITTALDEVPVLEEIQIWYNVKEECRHTGTTPTLDENVITQNLDMIKRIMPHPAVVPIPGSTIPMTFRTYGYSKTYNFDFYTRDSKLIEDLITSFEGGDSVTWQTKAFTDEWESRTVHISNLTESEPEQNMWTISVNLEEE